MKKCGLILLLAGMVSPVYAQTLPEALRQAEDLRQRYHFNEAGALFSTIAKESRDSLLCNRAEQLLLLCENGQTMLRYIETPKVTGKITVPQAFFFNYYTTDTDVHWAQAPANLLFAVSTADTLSPVAIRKDTLLALYFSAQLSGNWDIYVIRRVSDNQWMAPEPLATVNTAFDERFPYVTPDGKTLYFSSNGHSGIGGYDLFKSTFDPATRQWGIPENLGLPYSSPHDDLLFVPNADRSVALFASSRDEKQDSLTIYRIVMEANPVKQSGRTVSEIQALAQLEPLKNTAAPEYVFDEPTFETPEDSYPALYKILAQQRMNEQLVQDDLAAIRKMYALVSDEPERAAILDKIKEYENELTQMQERMRQTMWRISQVEQSLLEKGIVPEWQPAVPKAPVPEVAHTPFVPRFTPSIAFPAISIKPSPEEPEETVDRTFCVTDTPAVYYNPPVVAGLIYRIQIGTFSRRLPVNELNKLSPVFIQSDKQLFIHYVGQFTRHSDAMKALPEIKKRGFGGAIVAGMVDGKKVTLKAAREQEATLNTTEPATVFNVVLGEYPNGLPADLRQSVQQYTGKDIVKIMLKGQTVFIVGPFNTETDAKNLQTQLQAKGYMVTID